MRLHPEYQHILGMQMLLVFLLMLDMQIFLVLPPMQLMQALQHTLLDLVLQLMQMFQECLQVLVVGQDL